MATNGALPALPALPPCPCAISGAGSLHEIILERMEQLHLQVKEQRVELKEQLTAAQEQTVLRMQQLLALQHAAVSPFSDTTLAHTVLQTLRLIPAGIVDATAGRTGDSVLTAEQQSALLIVAEQMKEAGVVRFITPYLRRLCLPPLADEAEACPPVLVNSEHLQWLVPPTAEQRRDLRLKPDLFQSWLPFVEFRGDGNLEGVLGGYALQQAGCVAELFEAKRDRLPEAAFGELCGYHSCIKGPCHGMLFDAQSFQLYQSSSGHPVRLVKSTWTSEGSQELVRSFFSGVHEPPLLVLLRELLKSLDLRLCHINGRCYLGSGAYGHVFTVGTQDRAQALKVALSPSHTHVSGEYDLLRRASAAGAPVVRPVAGSVRELPGAGGGGYLLEKVGKPFTLSSARQCRAAFASLAAVHRAGIIHGDPRVPNLLLVDNEAVWIDLQAAVLQPDRIPAEQQVRVDAGILVHSILGQGSTVAFPDSVARALALYVAADDASVVALADAVWLARPGVGAAE
jgi:hypothetical protein